MGREIEELIYSINSDRSKDKRGGNSICYFFADKILLYGPINITHIDRLMTIINETKEKGINLVPILDYKVDDTKPITTFRGYQIQTGWTLQEKAKGKEMYQSFPYFTINREEDISSQYSEYKNSVIEYYNSLKKVANASQDQINKFVSDYETLEQSELLIDPSKPSNFFYDEEQGFSFIDINKRNLNTQRSNKTMMEILTILIPRMSRLTLKSNQSKKMKTEDLILIPKEIISQMQDDLMLLLGKYMVAFRDKGYTQEQISSAIQNIIHTINNIKDNPGYNDEQAIEKILNTLEEINKSSINEENDDITMNW